MKSIVGVVVCAALIPLACPSSGKAAAVDIMYSMRYAGEDAAARYQRFVTESARARAAALRSISPTWSPGLPAPIYPYRTPVYPRYTPYPAYPWHTTFPSYPDLYTPPFGHRP